MAHLQRCCFSLELFFGFTLPLSLLFFKKRYVHLGMCNSEMIFQVCGILPRNLLSTDCWLPVFTVQLLFFSSASNSKYCQTWLFLRPDVTGVSSLPADSENIDNTGGSAIFQTASLSFDGCTAYRTSKWIFVQQSVWSRRFAERVETCTIVTLQTTCWNETWINWSYSQAKPTSDGPGICKILFTCSCAG